MEGVRNRLQNTAIPLHRECLTVENIAKQHNHNKLKNEMYTDVMWLNHVQETMCGQVLIFRFN